MLVGHMIMRDTSTRVKNYWSLQVTGCEIQAQTLCIYLKCMYKAKQMVVFGWDKLF